MENIDGISFETIATTVAAIIALSLTLRAAIGPTLMYVTEAVKAAINAPEGKGGIIALGIGSLFGIALTVTVGVLSGIDGTSEYVGMVLVGLLVGLFVTGGAVEAHKAAALVNTEASRSIAQTSAVNKAVKEAEIWENAYESGHKEGIRTAEWNASNQQSMEPVATLEVDTESLLNPNFQKWLELEHEKELARIHAGMATEPDDSKDEIESIIENWPDSDDLNLVDHNGEKAADSGKQPESPMPNGTNV